MRKTATQPFICKTREILKWGSSSLRLGVEILKYIHAQVLLGQGIGAHLFTKEWVPSLNLKVLL